MISEAIIDSGIFIGRFDKNDQYHDDSDDIFKAFEQGHIKRIYLTDYVVSETLNFLLKRVSQEAAESTMDYIFGTDSIKVIFIDSNAKDRIMEIFKKRRGLSWTDCSIVYLSEKTGIKTLLSFDTLFDRVPGINRSTRIN